MIRNPDTKDTALVTVAEWVKDTCVLMGTSIPTAYTVAAIFIRGLEVDISQEEA